VTLDYGPLTGGKTITLTGSEFASTASVYFGTTKISAADVTFVSSTQLTVTTPSHAKGRVTVQVKTNGGTSNKKAYFYVTKPIFTSMSIYAGPTAGGATIRITGKNFYAPATVTFGSTAGVSVTVVSQTLITVRAPAHVAGTVVVKLTTPGGTATTTKSYSFEGRPTITSVTPPAGPSTYVKQVVIIGTGFVTGGTTVKIGSVTITTASVKVTSTTKLTVTLPTSSPGAQAIVVSTAGGTSLPYTYVYDARPTIKQLTPASAPAGTTISITGTGFTATSTVAFGTTPGTTVVFVNTATLTVKAPAHALGAVTVTVTTPGGTSVGKTFTYTASLISLERPLAHHLQRLWVFSDLGWRERRFTIAL
jgi:hypothetical protein